MLVPLRACPQCIYQNAWLNLGMRTVASLGISSNYGNVISKKKKTQKKRAKMKTNSNQHCFVSVRLKTEFCFLLCVSFTRGSWQRGLVTIATEHEGAEG